MQETTNSLHHDIITAETEMDALQDQITVPVPGAAVNSLLKKWQDEEPDIKGNNNLKKYATELWKTRDQFEIELN